VDAIRARHHPLDHDPAGGFPVDDLDQTVQDRRPDLAEDDWFGLVPGPVHCYPSVELFIHSTVLFHFFLLFFFSFFFLLFLLVAGLQSCGLK
jgi:hypothetical protein